ncbi:unnamed protein product [Heligmosomoides polygyrus]|uniref:N-acetyltransferase domain-containing protein n=1 Tax=Heligmosomoides polygyrus TaxID=6339 RepID=A0A3P7YIJ4_HELPZ|nr:unnamed protein product [Heligmosomoides polygyrus]
MDDLEPLVSIMVEAYTTSEPIARALNVSRDEAEEFCRGFLPHYLPQGYTLVMESEGQVVGAYLMQFIERPNPVYDSGPDPDLPPSIFLIETIAHKLTEKLWDVMPVHFNRCMHALYVVVTPAWQNRGAASVLTAAAVRLSREMKVDVGIAEVLSDNLLNLIKPFGFFELRSIPHSHWKDRKGNQLFKVKGANRSVLTVMFLKKTMIESKL